MRTTCSGAGRGRGWSRTRFALAAAGAVICVLWFSGAARAADESTAETRRRPAGDPAGSIETPKGRAEAPKVAVDNPKGVPSPTRARQKWYGLPTVSTRQYVKAEVDSIRAWAAAEAAGAGDRQRIYGALHGLLRQYNRFGDKVAETYPRNELEWLLITDEAADTLTARLGPVLRRYVQSNPNEILTTGRQLIEADLATIAGPPSGVMGFHVVRLSNWAYAHADSLLASGKTTDTPGVEDGVLRAAVDWCALYDQWHKDPVTAYSTRLSQEDWIVARMEDNCGHKGAGTWDIVQQYMSVAVDTTVTPFKQSYAHELYLKAKNCEQDTVIVYIDLPNFEEMQAEVHRRQEEKRAQEESSSGH